MRTREVLAVFMGVALFLARSPNADGGQIHDACREGQVEKIKSLLQADPKLVATALEDGTTPLHLAALEGHAEAAGLLLGAQAVVDARGPRRQTALHLAMYGGHRAVAEVLLEHGADPSARNAEGQTPLHLAAARGHRELVALLLERQADPEVKDNDGATPLMLATTAGHLNTVRFLAGHKADVAARDASGKTALMRAAEAGRTDVVEFIQKLGGLQVAGGSETARVGDYLDLERLSFEGNQAFTAAAIRNGLQWAPTFLEISHPMAPLDEYLQGLRAYLELGYRHNGFPEAHAELREDAAAGCIRVKLQEGPRYLCGEISVTGTSPVPAAVIVERLTRTNPVAPSALRAFTFEDRPKASVAPLEALPPGEACWAHGQPARFSEFGLRQFSAQITNVFREHGYFLADFSVQLIPDRAKGTADLHIDVANAGSPARLGEVRITGNHRHSREVLLRYTGLRPDAPLTSKLIEEARNRLWDSARFLEVDASPEPPLADGRVPLLIKVREYEAAPTLDQEFSREERALLKTHDWLSRLGETGEDLVVRVASLREAQGQMDLVLSPTLGLAVRVRGGEDGKAAGLNYCALLRSNFFMVAGPANKRKLSLEKLDARLTSFLAVEPNSNAGQDNLFSLTMGAGFHGGGDQPEGPYEFVLRIPRVALVAFVHRMKCEDHFEGDLLVRSNRQMQVKLDSRTGRLVQWEWRDEEKGGQMLLRAETGAFMRLQKEIEAEAATCTNAFDSTAPLSSPAAFLVEELFSPPVLKLLTRAKPGADAVDSLPQLIRQMQLGAILAPLDQFWPAAAPAGQTGERFVLPNAFESPDAAAGGFMSMVASWLIRHSDNLFAARSWPWVLMRETGFVIRRKPRYTSESLQAIYESRDTGPIGFLASAALLENFQPPLSRRFAARGLERMSSEDFLRDCRMLMATNTLLGQCVGNMTRAAGKLPREQLDALLGVQPSGSAAMLRQAAERLQSAGDKPPYEVLAPLLAEYWDKEARAQVAAALQRRTLNPVEAFKQAVAFSEKGPNLDDPQAAKLFEAAADQGHPGAAYMLGKFLEKGRGVEKNVEAAVERYRAAAIAGVSDASMALGQLYQDGLEVPSDPAEAYAWYSLGLDQGNRIAAALLRSITRKLNSEDLARAQRRRDELKAEAAAKSSGR